MQLNSRHWRNRAEEARLLAETMTRHWRNRVEESRLLAETMSDTEARQTMLAIADLYQKMAKIAERSEVIPKRTNGPSHRFWLVATTARLRQYGGGAT